MTQSRAPAIRSAALVVAAVLATLVPALAVAARPSEPWTAAAVFPPWWSADRIHRAANTAGQVTSSGRSANVVVVWGGTDLAPRLRAAGAWLILDPGFAGCGPLTGRPT
tara:strand:- start:267 stop:593 length:327 start_codon:yes stop_codon:yes gene_type:complete